MKFKPTLNFVDVAIIFTMIIVIPMGVAKIKSVVKPSAVKR